nr:MAG TPA: hypothetical protein [Caudoviricetes sp.]
MLYVLVCFLIFSVTDVSFFITRFLIVYSLLHCF